MTDPNEADEAPDGFGDLPLQPTGSGVADLEIAYEQMRLSAGADAAAARADDDLDALPADGGDAEAESEGHPS